MWPEKSGVGKGHLAFAGEQLFEGVSPYPPRSPGPIQPRSTVHRLLSVLHSEKTRLRLLGAAPSSHPGLRGEWHVWRGGRIPEPAGGWLKIALLTKSLFQPVVRCHPEPWGQTTACPAAEIAAPALTPVRTPGRKLWFPLPLKLLYIWLPPARDKLHPSILVFAVGLASL